MNATKAFATLGVVLGMAVSAQAVTNVAAGDITTSTTWTLAKSPYNLQGQVYVTNGATLTIEAGVRIENTANAGGSLAITRGSKIVAVGTANAPIVFTSTNDNGSYRLASNEWGNLTIMGEALISASNLNAVGNPVATYKDGAAAPVVNNTKMPTGLNKSDMEGLNAAFVGDPKVLYGGSDDDDDSGTLKYVSIRFGGDTTAVENEELNGLSMGGIGRGTDIDYLEIYCNVDDGIETWGGTVNYRHIVISNIGDDSFDMDQGWRGKAQFGLIIQGYSAPSTSQGTNVGDNLFETDGAEASDAQPVLTGAIYNFTAIGEPTIGDQATAWRDGARMQYRNMLFVDVGDKLIKEEASETGSTNNTTAWQYGLNGTALWYDASGSDVWDSPYTDSHDLAKTVNENPGDTVADLELRYQAQTAGSSACDQGYLAEMTDSLFFNIHSVSDNGTKTDAPGPSYTRAGADTLGVTVGGGSAPDKCNVVANTAPLTINRYAPVPVLNGAPMQAVQNLDPRPILADAQTSAEKAPNDGFFTPAQYRGGFSKDVNWAKGWTALDEYSMFIGAANASDPTDVTVVLMAATCFTAADGSQYLIERTDDGTTWSVVGSVQGTGQVVYFPDVDNAPAAPKAYRVTVQ